MREKKPDNMSIWRKPTLKCTWLQLPSETTTKLWSSSFLGSSFLGQYFVKHIHETFHKKMLKEEKLRNEFASEGKTDEVKEFMIAERTVKVYLLHFRLEYLRKCVTDRI